MAHRFDVVDGIVEVHVTGQPTKWELLEIFGKLQARDPQKTMSDLWFVSEETVIPPSWHAKLADAVRSLATAGVKPRRSAVVAANQLHMAMLDMYRQEAEGLPFEVGVFLSADEARAWLKGKLP